MCIRDSPYGEEEADTHLERQCLLLEVEGGRNAWVVRTDRRQGVHGTHGLSDEHTSRIQDT